MDRSQKFCIDARNDDLAEETEWCLPLPQAHALKSEPNKEKEVQ